MDGAMQIYLGVQTKSPQHTTPLLKAGGRHVLANYWDISNDGEPELSCALIKTGAWKVGPKRESVFME